MFDKIEIDGEKVDVYFDIENFKLKIDRYDWTKIVSTFDEKIVKIKNFVLFIQNIGVHNNYSYEYDVLFYIHCDYDDFNPLDLNKIIISSEEISYLLYSEKRPTKRKYLINKDNCEFNVSLNRSNKIQKWYYNEIKTGGNVTVEIIKCKDWDTYGKIINSIIDSISISTLTRRTNDFEILICRHDGHFKGSIKFPKIISNDRKSYSLGNIDIIGNEIKKIISKLVDTPIVSQFIIPCYSNYHNQLEFYKLYACFEYEYKKIEKDKMYSKEQKQLIRKNELMKENIKNILNNSKVEVTEHYKNSLNNYNPMEGHKQKLRNAVDYSKRFMNERFLDMNFYNREKEFINYIYKTRTKIIHEPNDNIEIENSNFVDIFNEIIYAIFLKRCGISNKKIEKICKEILIPYV